MTDKKTDAQREAMLCHDKNMNCLVSAPLKPKNIKAVICGLQPEAPTTSSLYLYGFYRL